jgi:hypothetical protein
MRERIRDTGRHDYKYRSFRSPDTKRWLRGNRLTWPQDHRIKLYVVITINSSRPDIFNPPNCVMVEMDRCNSLLVVSTASLPLVTELKGMR